MATALRFSSFSSEPDAGANATKTDAPAHFAKLACPLDTACESLRANSLRTTSSLSTSTEAREAYLEAESSRFASLLAQHKARALDAAVSRNSALSSEVHCAPEGGSPSESMTRKHRSNASCRAASRDRILYLGEDALEQ